MSRKVGQLRELHRKISH